MKYADVVLDPVDAARLEALNDKTSAIQKMVEMFIETGERRITELQGGAREMWKEIGAKYGLDLEHVGYQPSKDGKRLVAQMVRFNPDAG